MLGSRVFSKQSRPGVLGVRRACSDCGQLETGNSPPGTGSPTFTALTPQPLRTPDRPALHHPSFRHLRAPPSLRAASSSGAPARTCEKRRRSAVRRSSGSPFPLAGREVSMGHPPPPLGAVSMARRRRRSASSATQVDLATDLRGEGRVGEVGRGRE